MRSISGDVQPRNKVTVDFDKIGHIDKARTHVYAVPVNEQASLKFRLKGVKASRVELVADSVLLSVIVPKYEDTWTPDDAMPLDFFGAKNFHRGLLDVPVEVRITTDDTSPPSLMIGVVTPSLRWEDMLSSAGPVYEEEVTVGSDSGEKKLRIIYHRSGCGFTSPQDQ